MLKEHHKGEFYGRWLIVNSFLHRELIMYREDHHVPPMARKPEELSECSGP